MKRKLIKQGGGGFTFYLPKKWADKRGLKAGDEISLREVKDSLIINGTDLRKKEISSKDVNMTTAYEFLLAAHINGFDKITIKTKDPKLKKEIERVVDGFLLGFEIISKDEKVVIENVAEPTDKFENIVRRLWLMIKELERRIGSEQIKDFEQEKVKLDKYATFCMRTIMQGSKEDHNLDIYWDVINALYKLQHSYVYLLRYSNEVKVSEILKKHLNKVHNNFQSIYEIFYKGSVMEALEISESLFKQFKNIDKDIEKSKGKESVKLAHMKHIIRSAHILASEVADMKMERKIQEL
ncbi:MAG: hypothetical protein U9R08_03305 [Nanoarchaeota archaeon]|nr:hypothetical protein [Nanoarchaeota archaeon]